MKKKRRNKNRIEPNSHESEEASQNFDQFVQKINFDVSSFVVLP